MTAPDVFLVGPPFLGAPEALSADGLAVGAAPTCISGLLRIPDAPPRVVVLGGRAAAGREAEAVLAFRESAPGARILLTVPSSLARRSPEDRFGADATLAEPFAPADLVATARRLLAATPPVPGTPAGGDLVRDLSGLSARVACLADLSGFLVDVFRRWSRAARVSLLLYDRRRRELYSRRELCLPAEVPENLRIPLGQGIAGHAALRREPVVVDDIRQPPWCDLANRGPYESHSCLSVPLVAGSQRLLGVLNLSERAGGAPFSTGDVSNLRPVLDQTVLSIATAMRIRGLRKLSKTDELTRLYNFRYFGDLLDREIRLSRRRPQVFGLALIDVDHFRRVNHSVGHVPANSVLRRIAEVLRQAFRATDVLARYGGDEFGVLLPDVERTTPGIEASADRVVARVRAERFVDLPLLPSGRVTISMGVSFFPTDGLTRKDLVVAADNALYRAKAQGRDRACFDTRPRSPAP